MANWTSNAFVNALLVGSKFSSNSLTYRFDNSGSGGSWSQNEKRAFEDALDSWSAVANITFTETFSTNADLTEALYFSSAEGDLGVHQLIIDYDNPSLLEHSVGLAGEYNTNGFGWDDNATGGLSVGGFGYATLVHELGHALGLDHTHSDGGGDPHVFPGVSNSSDTGSNELNQDVYSIMSYVSGEISRPLINGQVLNYGYMAGPMAFDIAAIQYLYGANTSQNSGNNVYYLPTSNSRGTFFETIWDTGGTDTISYRGALNATIDLRSASHQNEAGGGGFVSGADGIFGGFTIAGDFTNALGNSGGENGVIIENAIGGSGVDTITGNDVANSIWGNAGNDFIDGGGGDDKIVSGSGDDFLRGGEGNDILDGGLGGQDTASYLGLRDEYMVSEAANNSYTVTHMDDGFEGVDTLLNVEFLSFQDTLGAIDEFLVVNEKPSVEVTDLVRDTGQWTKLSSFVNYSDADGDLAVQYEILDDQGSQSFWLPGGFVDASQGHTFSADLMSQLWIQADDIASNQTLSVRAFDGVDWGDWEQFELTTEAANSIPTISSANVSLANGSWMRASDFITISDADGDDVSVRIWDSVGSDNFWLGGGVGFVDASAGYVVEASEFSSLWVQADAGNSSQTLWTQADDGEATSAWESFTLQSVGTNTKPTVNVENSTASVNGWLRMQDELQYFDAEGDSAETYKIWDNDGLDSFWLGGGIGYVDASTGYEVSVSQIHTLWLQANDASQEVWIQAYDGQDWSAWESFDLTVV